MVVSLSECLTCFALLSPSMFQKNCQVCGEREAVFLSLLPVLCRNVADTGRISPMFPQFVPVQAHFAA